jgi:flagellar protein FlaG
MGEMENKVATVATTPDPAFGQKMPVLRTEAPDQRPLPTLDPVDLRLVIEEDKASGSYVYRTVNRATGEVIQQFPREELLRMHEETSYVAGAIIRTKA